MATAVAGRVRGGAGSGRTGGDPGRSIGTGPAVPRPTRVAGRPSALGIAATAVALGIALAACGDPGAPEAVGAVGGTVRVLGAWDGPELDAFLATIRPFEERTGVRVLYTSTRDLTGEETRTIAAGDPPEVVGLAGPRAMTELARAGALVDLSDIVDEAAYKRDTAPSFVELGMVDGRLAGVFTRATVKGLIWYDPQEYRRPVPDSWDELVSPYQGQSGGTKLWCVGLGSGATSGWPGTDWIEDLVLRQSGPDVYDAWVAGAKPWSSPEIRRAFKAFGEVVADEAVMGGSTGASATSFTDAVAPLVAQPAGCLLEHQASFLPSFLPSSLRPGRDYDFFPFPGINPRYDGSLVVGGDLFGMLRDTPQARALIRYLVSTEAQSIRVRLGGALSANTRVVDYPDSVTRRMAALLVDATRCRFDGSDMMPDAMGAAFQRAVMDFTTDQSRLDEILARLDTVQAASYGG